MLTQEHAHALRIQQAWRSVLARRVWTELLIRGTLAQNRSSEATAAAELLDGPAAIADAAAQQGPARQPSPSPSLEEARAMAQGAAGNVRAGSGSDGGHAECTSLADAAGRGARSPSADPGGMARGGAVPRSEALAEADSEVDAGELQFTAETAKGMGIEALRELMSVLTRLTVNRNEALVALLQKRDELLHERQYREQLVQQLLAQVDNSRALRGRR